MVNVPKTVNIRNEKLPYDFHTNEGKKKTDEVGKAKTKKGREKETENDKITGC